MTIPPGMSLGPNPLAIISVLAVLSLLPVLVIMTTSFVKTSMVLLMARESLGVQQVPPNIVIYSLSLVLTFYVMGPVYNKALGNVVNSLEQDNLSSQVIIHNFKDSSVGVKNFLIKHSPKSNQVFFYKTLKTFWTPSMMASVKKDDFVILIPSFMVSELTQAFKIGFLIYLPAVMIDIIVSNILMAMGMMMMSPVTISLPIKLLLFIALNGWERLIYALLSSYH